ncbi:MAG: hypothetical protein ACLSVD_13490 [Eggerthellaceae bacterium]
MARHYVAVERAADEQSPSGEVWRAVIAASRLVARRRHPPAKASTAAG